MGLLLTTQRLSLGEEGAAFLAAAVVAKSHEVETTPSIVKLWKDIQAAVPFNDDTDFISAILLTGRIMDMKHEISDPAGLASMLTGMRKAISDSKVSEKGGHGAIIAAFLTAARVAETREVESTSQIVGTWSEISGELQLAGETDIIPALLTIGRILELKRPVTEISEIKDIYRSLKEVVDPELKKHDIRVRNREIVTAYMASALVGSSPKIERIRDSVNTWLQVREMLQVTEDEDMISVILATGRVRDIDAMHLAHGGSIADVVKKIKEHVSAAR